MASPGGPSNSGGKSLWSVLRKGVSRGVAGKTDEYLSPEFTRLKNTMKVTRSMVAEIQNETTIFRKASQEYSASARRLLGVLSKAASSKCVTSEDPTLQLLELMTNVTSLADVLSADLAYRVNSSLESRVSTAISSARGLKSSLYEAVALRQNFAERLSSLALSSSLSSAAQMAAAQSAFAAAAGEVALLQAQCEAAMVEADTQFVNSLRQACAGHVATVAKTLERQQQQLATQHAALTSSGLLDTAAHSEGSNRSLDLSHASPAADMAATAVQLPLVTPPLLPGEVLVTQARSVLEERSMTSGVLVITNYRIRFFPNAVYAELGSETAWRPSQRRASFLDVVCDAVPASDVSPASYVKNPVLTVPLLSISRLEVLGSKKDALVVRTSDFRTIAWSLHSSDCLATVLSEKLRPHVWVNTPAFPFLYRLPSSAEAGTNGWNIYSIDRELERLQSLSPASMPAAYRVTSINEAYQLCPTYPSRIIVPATIPDSTIISAAKYRSKRRLPAVVWFNGPVSLSRASQPLAGLLNARSSNDETLLLALRPDSHELGGAGALPNFPPLCILDARPRMNALGNAAKGGGSESIANYPGCELVFLGIDNIHAVRSALQNLKAKITKSSAIERTRSIISGAVVGHEPMARSMSILDSNAARMRSNSLSSGNSFSINPESPIGLNESTNSALLEIDAALDDVVPASDCIECVDAALTVDDEGVDAEGIDTMEDSTTAPNSPQMTGRRNSDAIDRCPSASLDAADIPTLDSGSPMGSPGLFGRALKRLASKTPEAFRRSTGKESVGTSTRAGTSRSTEDNDAGNWLKLVSILLSGGVRVAERLASGSSVFVHCSDGWDRTAGLTTLGQLLIDPHYRTLEGFCLLVEKEWCSFGHRFARRCGTGGCGVDRADHRDDQRAPIFVQWLDSIWQIIRQMPDEFGFNENLLIALAEHAYSGRFGTFLFDCERERRDAHAVERTVSIWSMVLCDEHRPIFTNGEFRGETSTADNGLGDHLLHPNVDNVVVWPYWLAKWSS